VPASLRTRGSALQSTLRKLLDWSFVEEVPVVDDQQAWRADGGRGRLGLRITAAGLTAIGVPALETAAAESLSDRHSKPIKSKRPTNAHTSSGDSAGLDDEKRAAKPAPARAAPKRSALIVLLQDAEGVSISKIASTLGWLPHTTRAALTGLRQRGLSIIKSKRADGVTTYRLKKTASDTRSGLRAGRGMADSEVTVQP
jgi:Protein of unknown function (DUF3489)